MSEMSSERDIYATFTSDDEPTMALEPGMILGKFELIERIGRGGMGVVWSAQDRVGDRKVVLKFVSHDLTNFADTVDQLRSSFKKIETVPKKLVILPPREL